MSIVVAAIKLSLKAVAFDPVGLPSVQSLLDQFVAKTELGGRQNHVIPSDVSASDKKLNNCRV